MILLEDERPSSYGHCDCCHELSSDLCRDCEMCPGCGCICYEVDDELEYKEDISEGEDEYESE